MACFVKSERVCGDSGLSLFDGWLGYFEMLLKDGPPFACIMGLFVPFVDAAGKYGRHRYNNNKPNVDQLGRYFGSVGCVGHVGIFCD